MFCIKFKELILLVIILLNVFKSSQHENDLLDGHKPEIVPEDSSDYDTMSEESRKEKALSAKLRHFKELEERKQKEIIKLFKKIDKNRNNEIDRDELISHSILATKHLHIQKRDVEFEIADKNKDNKISQDEYFIYEYKNTTEKMEILANEDNSKKNLQLKKKIQQKKDHFQAADRDGDGFLNSDEYLHFKNPMFFSDMVHLLIPEFISFIDVDYDNFINKQEYVDFFKDSVSYESSNIKKTIKETEEDFKKFDKDYNGKIDVEEYHDIIEPGYEKPTKIEVRDLIESTDKNDDRVLTLEEIQKNSYRWLKSLLIFATDEDEDDEDQNHIADEL